jgi:putative endonuclease
MQYVYVLRNAKSRLYTGYTSDLRRRFKEHNNKESISTKSFGPWKLIYYEACESKKDALIRERYLKSTWGKRYIRNRVKHSA